MDWRCDSSSRALALQTQNPEFKPQSHKKEKKKTSERISQARHGAEDPWLLTLSYLVF
jgi:hypothetical protein